MLDLLPRHIILTSAVVSGELNLTIKAANDALRQLAAAGVLLEYGTGAARGQGRPPTLYVSDELLALAGSSPLR